MLLSIADTLLREMLPRSVTLIHCRAFVVFDLCKLSHIFSDSLNSILQHFFHSHTAMYFSLLLLSYLSHLANSQPLIISHPQPYSIEPRPNSIANHHVVVDHNPANPPPSAMFQLATSCLSNVRLLCRQITSSNHAHDQWIWVANEGCQVGYWYPSSCGSSWSQVDCEAAGANMVKQLQEGISFVPEINRASVNVEELPYTTERWERREAADNELASMVMQI